MARSAAPTPRPQRVSESVSAADLRLVVENVNFLHAKVPAPPLVPRGFEVVLQHHYACAQPEADPACTGAARLPPLEDALWRRERSCLFTGTETALGLALVRDIRLIYASMGRTLADYARNHALRVAIVRTDDDVGSVALPRGCVRRGTIVCAPVTMQIHKVLVAVAQLVGRIHRHATVRDYINLTRTLVQESPVRIQQVPLLPVSLEAAFTLEAMYRAFLKAMDQVAGLTLYEQELDKKVGDRFLWSTLAQHLLNLNVAVVAIHGLRREHRMSPMAELWKGLRIQQCSGIGVMAFASAALEDLPRDGVYRQLFPDRRPVQVPSFDLLQAEPIATGYWTSLGLTGRPVPANLPQLVCELLGQREWIDAAMDRVAEQVVAGVESPEAVVDAVLKDMLADIGDLRLYLARSLAGEEIPIAERRDWSDYMVLPTVGAAA